MSQEIINKINKDQLKPREACAFSIGDSVKVHVRIKEGEKERVQIYAGHVIARKGSGATETFTVRRVSFGEGTERVFPVHSPNIDRVEVVSRGAVRRAKLYYLRQRSGKSARIKTMQN